MKSGFTLVELLLTVALIAVLSGSVLFISLYTLRASDLDQAFILTRQTLRRAQTLSQESQADSPWGVRVQVGSVTLFQGQSYASRVASADEAFQIATTITPSDLTEIVFAKSTGFPLQSGVMTLTHETAGTRKLSVNSIGLVEEVTSGGL